MSFFSWIVFFYLTLLQFQDTELSINAVIHKFSSRRKLSRVHPESLFCLQAAREWVEKIHLMGSSFETSVPQKWDNWNLNCIFYQFYQIDFLKE